MLQVRDVLQTPFCFDVWWRVLVVLQGRNADSLFRCRSSERIMITARILHTHKLKALLNSAAFFCTECGEQVSNLNYLEERHDDRQFVLVYNTDKKKVLNKDGVWVEISEAVLPIEDWMKIPAGETF